MYTPDKTVRAEDRAALFARQAMGEQAPFDVPLEIVLTVRLPVPTSWSKKRHDRALAGQIRPTKRPDADNYLKLYADGMNGIVYRDDALIVEARVRKVFGASPGVRVEVFEVDGECS